VLYYLKHLELQSELLREARARGCPAGGALHVFDANGLSVRTHLCALSRALFAQLSESADAHYPESLGTLLVVNSGAAFPLLWAVGKTFLSAETRRKVRVFPGPPQRDFFSAGGWPAELRQLLGGRFPSELYPNARPNGPAEGRLPPWEAPAWKLLGYPGPLEPPPPAEPPRRRRKAKPSEAEAAPPARARAPRAAPEPPPHPHPPPQQPPRQPPQQRPPPAAARAQTPPRPGTPPSPAAVPRAASAAIWEMAAARVAAARRGEGSVASSRRSLRDADEEEEAAPPPLDGRVGLSRTRALLPQAAPLPLPSAGAGGGGSTREDVSRWVAAAAAVGPPLSIAGSVAAPGSAPPSPPASPRAPPRAGWPPPPPPQPPPQLSLGRARVAAQPARRAPRLEMEVLREDEGSGSGSDGGGERGSWRAAPPAADAEALLQADAVWSAVLEVAASMELFGPDPGHGNRARFDRARTEAAAAAAAAEGWTCAGCGARFALQDVALAQACEARHARPRPATPPRRAPGSPGYARGPPAAAARARAPPPPSKWGGSPRDAPAEAGAWTRAETVEAARLPPPSPAPASPGPGLGRVETSEDARRKSSRGGGCSVQRPSCAAATPAACTLQ